MVHVLGPLRLATGMGDYVHCRYCGQFYDSDKNGSGACSYHPKRPVVIGDAGRRFDHADLWSFPCCGKTLTADVVEGSDARPEQAPGCQVAAHVPETGWRVFLSYARRDEANAVVIESELRRRGHRVWRDRSDMVAGVAWADSIDDAIRKADHVVVVLTRRSVRSEQVNREVELALDEGIRIVPILLEDCDLPDRLRSVNCIDWRSRFDERFFTRDGFDELREAVIFGSADGVWVQETSPEELAGAQEHVAPPAPATQTLLVKDADGDVLAELTPKKRYEWVAGHLVSIDGVVYVVTDVLQRSRSNVEVRVERAMA